MCDTALTLRQQCPTAATHQHGVRLRLSCCGSLCCNVTVTCSKRFCVHDAGLSAADGATSAGRLSHAPVSRRRRSHHLELAQVTTAVSCVQAKDQTYAGSWTLHNLCRGELRKQHQACIHTCSGRRRRACTTHRQRVMGSASRAPSSACLIPSEPSESAPPDARARHSQRTVDCKPSGFT